MPSSRCKYMNLYWFIPITDLIWYFFICIDLVFFRMIYFLVFLWQFSSNGYWEWKYQAFPEVAYLRNLDSSLKDVKMEKNNTKIELVENLKIITEKLKIVVKNLKIKVGNLSETIVSLYFQHQLLVFINFSC